MTALTATQISQINKMNRASQKASLGTVISTLQGNATVSGSVSVSGAQASASAVVINPGLGTNLGYVVTVSRSGSGFSGSNLYITNTSGSLTVLPLNNYKVTSGDLVNWIAW